MDEEKRSYVPISWWLYRDLEGSARRVSDEQPVQDTYFDEDGFAIEKIVRPNPETYEILKRVMVKRQRYSTGQFGPGFTWVLKETAHRITKAEYETHLAFGLFEEE